MSKRQQKHNLATEKNIYNNIARGSFLLLLLITFLAVNPVMTSAFAEEDTEDGYSATNSNNYPETSFNNSDDADDTAALDTTVSSTVGISFSPAKYYADLAPTNSTGQSARIDLQTTIYVSNSGGYAIYLKTNNPNLVGEKDSNNFIPGATTAKTYTNMDVNTWGYTAAADVTSVPNNATYKAVIASGNGDKLAENTSDDIEVDTKTIALSFATKINDQKPADTYSNTMMLSVVSSPREIGLMTLTNMQDMTTVICAVSGIGDSKQLKDIRDGKFYWVTKLADEKCWMTQNLDLDIPTGGFSSSTETAGTPSSPNYSWKLSDMTTAWTNPSAATATTVSSSTILNDNAGSHSWSLGNYRITNPAIDNGCGSGKADIAACATVSTTNDRFTPYTTPTTANGDVNAHYIVGNHYQWNAATAGTGGTIKSGQASSSICPKNWRLPTSNDTIIGSFNALLTAGSISYSDVAKLTSFPYYFVRGGYVLQDANNLFNAAGAVGYYWSSTPFSNDEEAYGLLFNGTNYIRPSSNTYRRFGRSIRCLAR